MYKMELSQNMKIGLIVLGVLLLLGILFGTLRRNGILGGQASKNKAVEETVSEKADKIQNVIDTITDNGETLDEIVDVINNEETLDETVDVINNEETLDETVDNTSTKGCMDSDAFTFDQEATINDEEQCFYTGEAINMEEVANKEIQIRKIVMENSDEIPVSDLDTLGLNNKEELLAIVIAQTVLEVGGWDITVNDEDTTTTLFVLVLNQVINLSADDPKSTIWTIDSDKLPLGTTAQKALYVHQNSDDCVLTLDNGVSYYEILGDMEGKDIANTCLIIDETNLDKDAKTTLKFNLLNIVCLAEWLWQVNAGGWRLTNGVPDIYGTYQYNPDNIWYLPFLEINGSVYTIQIGGGLGGRPSYYNPIFPADSTKNYCVCRATE